MLPGYILTFLLVSKNQIFQSSEVQKFKVHDKAQKTEKNFYMKSIKLILYI